MRKILLVDDDSTVREVLAEALAQEGFEVIEADNGEAGVAMAIQHQPDLVVSDIVMPRMDGWDFCHALRLMPSTRTIPFIFLTSLDKTPDRILGLKLGADDYLTKPFNPQAVVFKVRAILKRIAQRRRLMESREEGLETDSATLLADVIEFLRHTQRTGLLAVYAASGKGMIYISRGRPVHASVGNLTGEAAVWELLRERPLQVKYLEEGYEDLPENITMTWEALMSRLIPPLRD